MPQRYRQLAATAETNTKLSYPEQPREWVRGNGTKTIADRYKKSGPSYPVPEHHYPFRSVVINENWQQPYIDPLTAIAVSLQAVYGSRYRVAGVANSGNKLVVIQNPTGPIEATARGFQAMENNARLGRFLAEMNAASVVRRRRGQ
jgi:hypothetical protein